MILFDNHWIIKLNIVLYITILGLTTMQIVTLKNWYANKWCPYVFHDDTQTNVDKDQVKDAIKSQQDEQINNVSISNCNGKNEGFFS